jgi:hypothetical protein
MVFIRTVWREVATIMDVASVKDKPHIDTMDDSREKREDALVHDPPFV